MDNLKLKPSLALLKFGPGIIEILLRSSTIVLAFGILVSSGIATDDIPVAIAKLFLPDLLAGLRGIHFLIFWSLVIMITEVLVLLVRFLNIEIINQHSTKCLIIDIGISAILFLGTIIPSSVALRAVDLYELASISEVEAFAAYSAAAIMGALLTGVFLVLAVWMALFIFMKWNDKVLNKSNQENGDK